MKKARILSVLLVATLLLTLLVGCGGGTAPAKTEAGKTEAGAKPAAGGGKVKAAKGNDTVVIATADETPSLSTAGHNAVAGSYVNDLTHNGLFRLDNKLNPVPELVESYKVEKDDKGQESIWVFKLHKGIKFSDGSDLTTDDVIDTLEYAKTMPDVKSYTKTYVKTEKVDDLTFKIFTDGPSASLLYDLSHHGNYILPSELIKSKNDWNKNPVGAGPYKLVEWKRGEQITFTANENYFNKERAPKIKNIVWRIIPEGSSRTIALEAGEVDYIIELDSTSVKQLEGNKDFAVMKVPSLSHNWLSLNNEKVPFDNENVRKAISAAVNRKDIITVALNGNGVPATAQTPAGQLGENTEGFVGTDMAKAKEYMKAWGGDPATIKLDMICSNDTKRRAAEVIQANLKEIGITATISSMDLATYLSETAAGNFTGFIGGYTSNEMMSFLKGVFSSANIGSSNKTRTKSAELDELIMKSTKTVDQAEREKILKAATAWLNNNTPQIPLYQNYILSAHNANLANTFISAGGSFQVQEWSWASAK